MTDKQEDPNPLRKVHRAYVEAGLMPLSDYVVEYDEPLAKPLYMHVSGPPIPEGFKQIMRLMGIEAIGLAINSSTGFTVTDKQGDTYTFQISRFQRKE